MPLFFISKDTGLLFSLNNEKIRAIAIVSTIHQLNIHIESVSSRFLWKEGKIRLSGFSPRTPVQTPHVALFTEASVQQY